MELGEKLLNCNLSDIVILDDDIVRLKNKILIPKISIFRNSIREKIFRFRTQFFRQRKILKGFLLEVKNILLH